MSRPGDFDVLTGTEVRLDDPSPTLPAKTFILDKKLSEEYRKRSQLDCDEGQTPPFAILSFSCHNSLNPSQQGFIRIYRQIPIDGTVLHPPEVRVWQASRPRFHAEIEALKQLYDKNCTAVPKLLGLGTELQGAGDFVPGGYITSIAWERVSGERIEHRDFWKRDLEYREQVRLAFSTAYDELKRCGWRPRWPVSANLIYDEATKVIHISGFRDAIPLPPEESRDVTFKCWGLVTRSLRHGGSEDLIW